MNTQKPTVLLGTIIVIIVLLIAMAFRWNSRHGEARDGQKVSSSLFLDDDAGEASVIQADADVRTIHEALTAVSPQPETTATH